MSQNQLDRQPDFSQPLKSQYVRLVITYLPNKPMQLAYKVIRETFTKKPESRREQLEICEVDAAHIANGLIHYAKMLHSIWFKEHGITQMQAVEMICEYLAIPNPPQMKDMPAVALMLEFDPDRKFKERYSVERESTENRQLSDVEQFEAMKVDMKHFANGLRHMANLMEYEFGAEFNLKEKEVIGNVCAFLKATIKGDMQELNVLQHAK